MSISCLRIRSSSRSSGPSYTSVTEIAKGESLSSFFSCAGGTSTGASTSGSLAALTTFSFMLLPIIRRRRLVHKRHSHRLAHLFHGVGRHFARPFRACLKNIPSQPRILLEFLAALLHRLQQLHERVGSPPLALDAPDAG